jgi:preprotein translocase subunit SecA
MTREQAVRRLREHLGHAITNRDASVASGLVAELVSYAPQEALDEIKEAFRRGLVDCGIVDLDLVQRSIAEGDSRFQKELKYCRPTGVQDTVAELSSWASFREEENSRNGTYRTPASATMLDDQRGADLDDEGRREPLSTIRNTARKIGRNDPCPCGSGKKYKKCCGAG